jgi:hypothetical protein
MKIIMNGEERDATPEEEAEIVAALAANVRPPNSANLNSERDRRIAAGFIYGGKAFDFDDRAKANISGAAQLAFMAIVAGAQPGDLFWNGGLSPFTWIAADNSLVTMDAQTVVEFGRTAAQHEQSHIFAARALKDMEPIPLDYSDDGNWP